MQSNESLEIMRAISHVQETLLSELGEVKKSVANLDGSMTANIRALKDTHATFREDMLSPGGRITNLENEVRDSKKRQWIHSSCVIPAITILRFVAHKVGVNF